MLPRKKNGGTADRKRPLREVVDPNWGLREGEIPPSVRRRGELFAWGKGRKDVCVLRGSERGKKPSRIVEEEVMMPAFGGEREQKP